MAEAIRSKLLTRWAKLSAGLGWAGDGVGVAVGHDVVVERYGAASRAYHNEQHLLECLEELELNHAAPERCDDPLAVELAIWFHDAVYDATRADNEAVSADVAEERLAILGEPRDRIVRVRELILDTAHRAEPATDDGRLIVDVDLSILGKPTARFDAYDAAIRAEYAHVPEAAYRAGRAAVLRTFLARRAIYRLPRFVERYEGQARMNLARAITRLEGTGATGANP